MHLKTLLLSLLFVFMAQVIANPVPDPANNNKNNGNNNKNNLANGISQSLEQQMDELKTLTDLRFEVGRNVVNKGQFQNSKDQLIKQLNDQIKTTQNNQKNANGSGAKDGLATVRVPHIISSFKLASPVLLRPLRIATPPSHCSAAGCVLTRPDPLQVLKAQQSDLALAKTLGGTSADLAVIATIMADNLESITQSKQNQEDVSS
jgi:hypothetical protein